MTHPTQSSLSWSVVLVVVIAAMVIVTLAKLSERMP